MKKLLGILLLLSCTIAYPMEKKAAAHQNNNDAKAEACDSEDENSQEAGQEAILTFPHVQFSPGIQDLLIKLISEEKRIFCGALFRFTLYRPAQKIVERMKSHNIGTYLVVDSSNIQNDFCSSLKLIAEAGGEVRQKTKSRNAYNPGNYEVMHHKFMIFGNNVNNNPLILTGSFNFTGQANLKNCENVVILDDRKSIDAFKNEFLTVWKLGTLVEAKHLDSQKDKVRSNNFARRMNGIPEK